MIIKFLRIRDTYDRIHFYYAPFIVLYEDEIEYIIHAYIYIYSIIARGQIKHSFKHFRYSSIHDLNLVVLQSSM